MKLRFISVLSIIAMLSQDLNGSLLYKYETSIESENMVEGMEVDIKSYPYQLSLLNNTDIICGAVIITKFIAITAAHCTMNYTQHNPDLWLHAGSSFRKTGGDIYKVSENIIHPQYQDNTSTNDITILKVESPLVFKEGVEPIKSLANIEPSAGIIATVTGWGAEANNEDNQILNMIRIPIISRKECKEDYKNFDDSMICGGYSRSRQGPCLGDSGSPLVVDEVLVGVVSFGTRTKCTQSHHLDYYANIANLRPFIDSYVSVKKN